MPLRHVSLAVLVTMIWGCNFVAINIGVGEVSPFLFLTLRFVVVIVPAIFFLKRPQIPWWSLLTVGGFMSLGQFALLYLALWMGMPAGLASLVLQSQVIFTVLIAAIALRERPTVAQIVGLSVGFVGLLVVGLGREASIPVLAFIVTLAAALSWAIGNIVVRFAGSAGGLSMTVWSAIVVPVPMFVLSLIFEGPAQIGFALTHLSLAAILSTLFTAYLASLVGYGIWNTLLAKYPAGSVVSFALLIPIFGMTAAWIALHEQPNAWELVGGAFLLVGVAITTGVFRFARWRRPRQEPGPDTAETSA